MKFSDLSIHRENEDMKVLLWENGCIKTEVVCFDDTITNIVIVPNVLGLGAVRVEIKVWTANDA